MESLEKDFPELTDNFRPTDFTRVNIHKPWNDTVGKIESIVLVSINEVKYRYTYLASLRAVDKK
jgi:hypothetical protein